MRASYGSSARWQEGGGPTTRIWYISSTADQFGNQIVYDYESSTVEETLPKEIVWTESDGESLAPRYKVAITYEDRPADDQRSGYDAAGVQWSRTQRTRGHQRLPVRADSNRSTSAIS
jgi:hypothetical protein